jgi:hypothetical protein
MRLINPGAGEYVDRLTIVQLKILFGTEAGADVSHFVHERAALCTRLAAARVRLEDLTELAAVNAAIWHNEDGLRALRLLPDARRAQWAGTGQTYAEEAAARGFRSQALNDQRAALVHAINEGAGDDLGKEKL